MNPRTIPAPQQLVEDLANVDPDRYPDERVRLFCQNGSKLEEMSPKGSHFAWIEYRPFVVLAKANWDSEIDHVYPGETLVEKPLDDVVAIEVEADLGLGCLEDSYEPVRGMLNVIWVRNSKGELVRLLNETDQPHADRISVG